ncbi:transcription-repair coupling factor [Occultella glacieicola]|uniref:Transcription-repair-coupling factor n=1 Tax=Occultella glacieicola TaxID=2518684 RepID=A0ABY2E7X3_9MICO|nr:transcription-repair coupling factor [Occultella glacieicola]TDE93976.1 transcription-repair coupling factor [Occultella glacieicola]
MPQNLTGILPALRADDGVRELLESLVARGAIDVSASAGARAPLLAELAGHPEHGTRPLVVVVATGREADDLAAALGAYLDPADVAIFPSWETLPHERLSPRSDTVARRIAVLRRLAHSEPLAPLAPEATPDGGAASGASLAGAGGSTRPIRVLILPIRAVLQPVVAGLGDLEPVALRAGDTVPMEQVIDALVAAAYTRVDMVERRGEFAVRGGLLDVFAPTEDHPQRIEFWGDDVEEIRWFSAADQRSLEVSEDGIWAPPTREVLLTDTVRARAADLVPKLPGAAEMLEKLSQGMAVDGMESLAPALVDRMEPVLDLVPADSLLIVNDPERVRRRAHDLVATTEEFLAAAWTSAAAGANTPLDLSEASFATIAQVRDIAARRGLGWWTFGSFAGDAELEELLDSTDSTVDGEERDARTVTVASRDVDVYRGETARAVADLRDLTAAGWRLVLVTEGPGPARRMVEQLLDGDVPARLVSAVEPAQGDARPGEDPDLPPTGVVLVTTASLGRGFVSEPLKLAVFTEADLTGRAGTSTRDMRRMPSKRRNVVDPLALRPGDYVVHEQHGVGKFVELIQRTIGTGRSAATREYLVIEYAPSKRGQPGDRLYVPSDALDQVTKYTGGESPSVNKMGGSDWAKTKGRARKAIKEIAGELIRLYSARMATKGHPFAPDTPWQRELEDAFAFVETPDQVVTIDEVKADMEKPTPMDRLISGDVGYGKTEIAVRAAFKAVQDGKQVAVLVPTTLLVQQHFDTFSERYAGFPVVVKGLSRFQSDAEARAVKEGIADGSVDVVIGTHRLLTGEVRFKDLGLVVVDEEQRFGVEHKETLKQLRTNVDVLAMSATPIPRTLEMAVTGIREMSTLATPPEERHPVLTFVGAYAEKQIAAAVRRELLREGQVFYVHNRVESIDRTASRLAELVPDARIAVAHGKMGEHQLERVIMDFWEKRFDVLVCTTIVETGLDISNANTLIVERADVLGLSQLHQLRGRVGRGRERAYAYFLYPPERPLTETAHDRLQTIAAHTDLGSGTAIAMKDLEIRGAGNLLGGEQSGHIAGVGFDLYVRMVSEAVANFRGEVPEELPELKVELPIDAHLPHEYIAHERLRLEAYTKIAKAADAAAIDAVREELVDRYGPVPEPVERLFAVASLRVKARAAGLADMTSQGKYIRFAPVDLAESAGMRLKRLYPGTILKPAVRTALVPAPTTSRVGGTPLRDEQLITWVSELIDAVLAPGATVAAAAKVASSS